MAQPGAQYMVDDYASGIDSMKCTAKRRSCTVGEGLLVALASLILALASAELLVRALVAPEQFWVVSNVYHAVADPDIGYTLRPSFDGPAFGVMLRTNRYGFRGPDWRREKDPASFRIALVGDSHAFGFGVSFEHTVGERLASILAVKTGRRFEVLNFGVSGYNSQQELAVFRTDVLAFSPDLVILLPCNNDHEPALRVDSDGYLHWTGGGEKPSQANRIVYKPFADLGPDRGTAILSASRLYLLLSKLLTAHHVAPPEGDASPSGASLDDDPSWMAAVPEISVPPKLVNSVMTPLREIIREARGRGIPVVLAPFAAPFEYRRLFLDLSEQEGVPLVELLARFPEVHGWGQLLAKYGLGWDPHLGAVAHERWAAALADLLCEQRMISGGCGEAGDRG
jgi:lysophospholipase L1-like esterase